MGQKPADGKLLPKRGYTMSKKNPNRGNSGKRGVPKGTKLGPVGSPERRKALNYNMMLTRIRHMPPIDTTKPEELWKRYDEYVELCTDLDLEQTMGLLCKAFGSGWNYLSQLVKGGIPPTDKWPEESVQALRDIYEYVEGFAELCLIDPDNRNAAQRIFHMKNRYGWTDVKEEHKIVEQRTLAPASQAELDALAKKYLAQAGVVDVDCEVEDG